MPVEQYAYLCVVGPEWGLDWQHPEELSALLHVDGATIRRRRLSPEQPGPRHERTTWWQLGSTDATDEIDTDVVVRTLLEPLQERSAIFREYVARHGLTARVQVVITMKAEQTYFSEGPEDAWGVPTPASYLSAETVQRVAALGVEIDFALGVWTPEEMQDESESAPSP